MKAILIEFKRLLGSLTRRTKRIEDGQLLSHRETQRKLDHNGDQLAELLRIFKPEVVRALERLPETQETVHEHAEWIRAEEAKRRAAASH